MSETIDELFEDFANWWELGDKRGTDLVKCRDGEKRKHPLQRSWLELGVVEEQGTATEPRGSKV